MEENTKYKESAWQTCQYCSLEHFKSIQEFTRHLRDRHCTKEGGSYVCRFGYNGVCNSLPLDGVSDRDYISHVMRNHITTMPNTKDNFEQHQLWSIYSASQNLPAVLNDPGRGKESNLFTKTWGDSFIDKAEIVKSYYLPEVNHSHFEHYLKKISRRYRKHHRLSIVSDKLPARTNHIQVEDDINVVPEIFLKPSLALNDAGTFNAVFPSCERDGRLLQEKLSHYLDVVEVQIAEQVSQKSSAFFHAMTSHDAIMEQMSCTIVEVRNLRHKVQQLDENLTKQPLKLLALARSRANHLNLLKKMQLMATVLHTQPTLQLLLSAPDYVGALELIVETQDLLAKELAGVTSLRHLPSQLDEMSRLIDKMLNTEFERYAAADLHRPLTGDTVVLDPDRLISIVAGLLRQLNLQFLEVYKHEAVTAAQAVLKQLLIENLADSVDSELCLTGSGETTPFLNSAQWPRLVAHATDALSKLILRVQSVHDIIKQTADNCCGHENSEEAFLSRENYVKVEVKLHNLLVATCDYCSERCANLISSQNDKNGTINAGQIMELSETVNVFNKLCEQVCGRYSPALGVAFKTQAGRYLHKFHSQRKTKLSLLLDNERWRAADVPPEFQALLTQLRTANFQSDLSPSSKEMQFANGATSSLVVGDETYVVVGAVLMLLRFICEYCTCAQQLPNMASSIGKSLLDLLQMFNSKTCQLVLGAGALQTAGLKTITSVNLALASRALQLVLWFLPLVKAHFETNLKADVKKMGFESVEENIGHHIEQLKGKILLIMKNIVGNLLNDWSARPPVPSQSFRNISKQYVKLHEAVGDILPQEQVKAIYSTVHSVFKERLREQLVKMNIINNGGPQHGVVTSELTFYLETLRTLKVLSESELTEKSMEDIWTK